MSFMQPELVRGDWWTVEGNQGDEVFPAEYFSDKEARENYSGEATGVTFHKDWYGARLSAPGYMDCTEWCLFETEEEALEYLASMCVDD